MILTSRPRRGMCWVIATWLAAMVAACSHLPQSGPVHSLPPDQDEVGTTAPYFAPASPLPEASPMEIAEGFLQAMQANPPSTAVARSYLTTSARKRWDPGSLTIVYATVDMQLTGTETDQVRVRLTLGQPQRLDARGSWIAGSGLKRSQEGLLLVQEEGQWRIDTLPNALLIPNSYFVNLFLPHHVYYFDSLGEVLTTERVYVPRGKNTATHLVRALLAGPSARRGAASVSAFPPGTSLELAVVVGGDGLVEVPLSSEVATLSSAELHRALTQITHTLSPLAEARRLRILVDGVPIPLPNGSIEMMIRPTEELSATGAHPEVVAISPRGQPWRVTDAAAEPTMLWPNTQIRLRSAAGLASKSRLAGVSTDGRSLHIGRYDAPSPKLRLRGRDLAPPAYDRYGLLWVLDSTPAGGKVWYYQGGKARRLQLPHQAAGAWDSLLVTNDGTHLVLASSRTPRLGVVALQRSSQAGEQRLQAGWVQEIPAIFEPGFQITAMAQYGPTTLVVAGASADHEELVFVELDGSMGDPRERFQRPPATRLQGLTGVGTVGATMWALMEQKLWQLEPTGTWAPVQQAPASIAVGGVR